MYPGLSPWLRFEYGLNRHDGWSKNKQSPNDTKTGNLPVENGQHYVFDRNFSHPISVGDGPLVI